MQGLKLSRRFTEYSDGVYSSAEWEKTEIFSGSGKSLGILEFPKFWSHNARQQVAEKYFRKRDVPQFPEGILDIHQAMREGIDVDRLPKGGETSLKQVINRLAGTWTYWGTKYGYFANVSSMSAFYDEIAYMMIHQMGAPNSPQWFNTGIFWAYGIYADPKGQWYFDFAEGRAKPSESSYEHPQAHACFILGVKDDLFNKQGIYDTLATEAKIFYFGSGAGSDYSTLRGKGEPVSGGGVSSGMISYLKLFDMGGGVIKSGGKNRRSAKMDISGDTHPELIDFVQWKMKEEKKVRILIEAGLDNHFEGEAYMTVSGMNANNTVALSHEFFNALQKDEDWHLKWVTDPNHISATHKARDIWDEINYATHFSGDPGIHARGTINEWNTCKNDEDIVSSNPCSEYLWFNETACNLASINLVSFYDAHMNHFDVEGYAYAIRMWSIVLDITVSMAQYPSEDFARKSIDYRTLGLGFSNLGGLLMCMGIGYGTKEGQLIGGALTALLGGGVYLESALMADAIGQYPRYEANKEHHLKVIRNHRRASYNASNEEYEDLTIKPIGLDEHRFPAEHANILDKAREIWDTALLYGERYGYRNAQGSVLAPTGTISFAMDCGTFGIEPDYALVKYKLLAGGGWATIINPYVDVALERLGYDKEEIGSEDEAGTILYHVRKHGTIEGAPYVKKTHYPVFDTAVKPKEGTRYLMPEAHIDMMAHCQPFLSGAISKTVNLPEEATIEDISNAYLRGYYKGLKAIAVFRDKSKASSVMYTDTSDQETGREPLDLSSHEFDIKKIFGGQFPASEDVIPEDNEIEVAEAVDMPTYGCKDGSCSL